MSFTPYLAPSEYASFGIGGASAADVIRASLAVDTFLGRSLLYTPDATGQPCYMTNAAPTASYTLTTALNPGSPATITIPGLRFPGQMVGSAVTLDRNNPSTVETCAITSAAGDTLTLDAARNNHSSGATLEFGLTLSETVSVTNGFLARVRAFPLVRVLSISGGYTGAMSAANLLTTVGRPSALSGWAALDLTLCDIDPGNGVCRLNTSAYGQARIEYLAGWTLANIPFAIKQAVASMVSNRTSMASYGMSGDIKMLKAGDATIARFGGSSIDADTMALLAPYRSVRMGG